jgi:uncharacterized alpha-E superfamily protein
MLSRVADSLYWMSRYLERAEHTARLLGLNLNQMLDQSPDQAGQRWARLLHCLNLPETAVGVLEAYAITRTLAFDTSAPASIISCVAMARENARQVRESISSEMWECLNRLYLRVRSSNIDDIWNTEPHEFFQEVKEGAHLFQGITDATINHNEIWRFIQVGRYLERAGLTATLLDVHFTGFTIDMSPVPGDAHEYLEWVALLKSCTAFESYCRVYSVDVLPQRIAEFLLLNQTSPRSIRFAADRVQHSLQAIARETGMVSADYAERLAGRLSADLSYRQIDEVIAEDLHSALHGVLRQCAGIHNAIQRVYIDYPIEQTLAR